MLVLSRKAGQKIQIGPEIELTIQRITPTRVRLGLVMPRHIRVLRSELKPPPPGDDAKPS